MSPQPWLDDDTPDLAPAAPPLPTPAADGLLDDEQPDDDIDATLVTIAPAPDVRTPRPAPGDEAPDPTEPSGAPRLQRVRDLVEDAAKRLGVPAPRVTERGIEHVIPAGTISPALLEERRLEQQGLTLAQQADQHQITDPASFTAAEQFLKLLAEAEAKIRAFFDEDVARAYATWNGLTQKRRGFLEPVERARKALGARYAQFERAEREAAERERQRREREAQEAERARLAQEAAELEAAAMTAPTVSEAQELQQQAEERAHEAATVQAPVLPVQRTVEPAKGISSRSNWTAEVTDKLALIRAVAEGKVSLEALEPNMVYLRARAKADKGGFVIPGVRVYDAGSTAVRRR